VGATYHSAATAALDDDDSARPILPGRADSRGSRCHYTAIILDTAPPTVGGTTSWPILRAVDSSGRLSGNDRTQARGAPAITTWPVFLARAELPGHAADRASHPARVPLWPPASSIP